MPSSLNTIFEPMRRGRSKRSGKSDQTIQRLQNKAAKAKLRILPSSRSRSPTDRIAMTDLQGETGEMFFWGCFDPRVVGDLPLPAWLVRIEKPSVRQDRFQATDALAILINSEKIRIQIKTSWDAKTAFERDHAGKGIVCVVVNFTKDILEMRTTILDLIEAQAQRQYPELFQTE